MVQQKLPLNLALPQIDKLPTSPFTHGEWTIAQDLINLLSVVEGATWCKNAMWFPVRDCFDDYTIDWYGDRVSYRFHG